MTAISSSRLGSAAKGDYHPTDMDAMQHIARILKPDTNVTILDPSCGNGTALAYLAEQWHAVAYGNEIEKDRCKEAATQLYQVTLGAQETLQVEGGVEIIFINPPYNAGATARLEHEHVEQAKEWLVRGGVMIAVLPKSILESARFWQMWLSKLKDPIIGAMVGPDFERFHQYVVFGHDRFATSAYFSKPPDGQAADLAESFRVKQPNYPAIDRLPTLNWRVWRINHVTALENSVPNGYEMLEALADMPDVFETNEYRALTEVPAALKSANPMMPCRSGHVIQLAAAGAVHGIPTDLGDDTYNLTGHWYKYTVTTKEKDPSTGTEVTKETEKTGYRLYGFSPRTGWLRTIDSVKNQDEYQEFLSHHTGALMDAVDEANPPRYAWNYDWYMPYFDHIHGPRVLPGREANGLFTAQKHMAAALCDVMKAPDGNPNTILVGEMGCGKTTVSAAAMAIMSGMLDGKPGKIVVLCPALVAPKWAEEAERILMDVPDLKVFRIGEELKQKRVAPFRPNGYKHADTILRFRGLQAKDTLTSAEAEELATIKQSLAIGTFSTKKRKALAVLGKTIVPDYKARHGKTRMPIRDLQEAMDYPGPAVVVIHYEVAKFGAPWEHILDGKTQHLTWTAQVPITNWNDEITGYSQEEREGDHTVYRCPTCGHTLIRENGLPWSRGKDRENEFCTDTSKRVKRWCPNCQAALWQSLPFSYGGRWPACEFLSQHYAGQYVLIVDEAHNAKGETNIGYASQDAITGATNVIAMTGTIYNGYAGSLFYLFYRLSPYFRTLYQHDEVEVFKHHHGFMETVTTSRPRRKTSAYGYSSTIETSYTHESPGASPEIIALMTPFTGFLRKSDLGINLPPKVEYAVPVSLGDSKDPLYRGYHELDGAYGAAAAAFINGNRGPLMRLLPALLGWPDAPNNEDLGDLISVSKVPMPTGGYPKDQVLINLILSEQAEGRGVAVFFEQVHKRDARFRIKGLLTAEGIYSDVLTEKTSADQRMDWIRELESECATRGQPPVLLCNGALVNEGIDLLSCPTIVEVGQHYNITKLRQRLERSHRIGQDKEVRLYFLYYEGTRQQTALIHIAAKLRAAIQVDGEHAAGIAAFEMDEGDFVQSLLRNAAEVERTNISDLMKVACFDTRPPQAAAKALPQIELHKTVADLPAPVTFKTIKRTGKSGVVVAQFTMF